MPRYRRSPAEKEEYKIVKEMTSSNKREKLLPFRTKQGYVSQKNKTF